MGIIILSIIILWILSWASSSKESKPKDEKSFFFDGGDEFTAEDYLFLSILDDDDY